MKKIVLLVAVTLVLTGCTAGLANPDVAKSENPDQVQVDESLLTVDITFPASFMSMGGEKVTQETVDKSVAEAGYLSGKLNDDGSVVYTMTKLKHNQIIDETKASFDKSTKESLANFPNVSAITRNDDFSEIRIEAKENDPMFGFLGLSLSMQAYFVQILNGKDFSLDVIVVDSTTGKELNRTKYPLKN